MPLQQWNNYRPVHPGVRFALYGNNKKRDTFGISLYGSSHNPNPFEDITMRDIDEELSRLKIVDERIRTRIFRKKKVSHLNDKEKVAMLHYQGMPYSQGFSGEYDYMSSRIKGKYRKWIPKKDFIDIKKNNKHVESFGEKKDKFGNKYVLVEYGDIAKV